MGCVLAAGCGGGSRPPKPVADRVCDGAQHAAALLGYSVSPRVTGRDAANLECTLHGQRLRVAIVSQASGQAYTEFDTTTAHQDQVYGSGVHEPGQIPVAVSVPGSVVAVWIRAQREIVATDAEPGRSGTYVTVTASGSAVRGTRALALARAVARATFAAHPDAGA
jgi:hypothetical protein